MNPFAFLWRQREAVKPEEEWPPTVEHGEVYRQRLNGVTIPCSAYYAGTYSHADFLGAVARVIASIVRTIEHDHLEDKTITDDSKRFILEVIDDQSIMP